MGSSLAQKNILLGISGGIAAYKAAYLTRIFKVEGADVWVCMTEAGTKFITPLTMETLSEREVLLRTFPENRTVGTRHITVAEWADAVVIAPATADILARMAGGIADDLLTTLLISTVAPVFVAPAMNTRMYNHPATRENMAILRDRGVRFIDPGVGDLACNTIGVGRMAEPRQIASVLQQYFSTAGQLKSRKIIVTAGPTQEPIDPVRYLGNRSSGKMGYRLAQAAADRGAAVVLISGPSAEPEPAGVEIVRVKTAAEMKAAVDEQFDGADAVVMAAAVADYRPTKPADRKIKKKTTTLQIDLEPTDDILRGLGSRKKSQVLVGFALETEKVVEQAQRKLKEKNLDLIVANDPGLPGAGFGSETNIATIIDREGQTEETGKLSKRALAEMIIDRIVALLPPRQGSSGA